MISILIITPYNYANTQNKYAIAGVGEPGFVKVVSLSVLPVV